MKRTIIIIVIGTLVLVAALWGASRHFGWFSEGMRLLQSFAHRGPSLGCRLGADFRETI